MSIIKDATATKTYKTMTYLGDLGMTNLAWRLWRFQMKRSLLASIQRPITKLHKKLATEQNDLAIDLEYVMLLHPKD